MKFDLKNFLKAVKLNESNISMVLGALVIVVVGILIVNYFKDRNAQTIPAISTSNTVPGEHVVVAGESLWSVAEDYYGSGYNWVDIAKENKLNNHSLEVGQKLSVPDVAVKQPTLTDKVVTSGQNSTISGDSYTVMKGDSLWEISVRTYGDGYKWMEIARANKLDNPNIIHTGNVLVLPR